MRTNLQFTACSAVLLLLSLGLSGCVGGDGPGPQATPSVDPEGDTGGVQGVVVDDSSLPIEGVEVAALDREAVTTRTDDQGRFQLSGLDPGTVRLAAQKLGYTSIVQNVNVVAGDVVELQLTLAAVAVAQDGYVETAIGDGYFACGAYLVVTSWGNLHACVHDNHQPRYTFLVEREGLMGIMQEVTWEQTSALTSEYLLVRLEYKPVCDPFCSWEKQWAEEEGTSPVRTYSDLEDDAEDYFPEGENPVELNSMTFPGGEGPSTSEPSVGSGPVIVFQQRMTHYISLFYWEHGDLETYTLIPDA